MQLFGTEGSALSCLAGVTVHTCPHRVHIGEHLPHPNCGCTKGAAVALATAMLVFVLEHARGMEDQGKREGSHAFLLRTAWKGGCLESQRSSYLVSTLAMRLCSYPAAHLSQSEVDLMLLMQSEGSQRDRYKGLRRTSTQLG